MTCEKSCGAVVFTTIENQIKYLLVQSLEGVYGFPKGHMEHGETEEETARREVFEETHIHISFLDGFRTVAEYMLPNKINIQKQVVYFLGKYEHQEVIYQREELIDACLATYDEAIELLRFDDSKRILRDANHFLLTR